MNIANIEEKNKARKKNIFYSESYVVKFWIKNDAGFTEQREVKYFAINSRSAHKQVECRFRRDYPTAKLISVIYE